LAYLIAALGVIHYYMLVKSDVCELSIKREPMGNASRYMHDQIKVGDTKKVSAPAGKFVFTGTESQSVLLIAGGVGITPLMSMVRYLTDRFWNGDVYFLVIAKTEKNIIFHEEIEYLKSRFPRLHVCITLTRSDPQSMWQGERGRANASFLNKFVPNITKVPVYLCGPNDMMDATRDLLLIIGIPRDLIKTEAFVSPGVAAIKAASSSPAAMDSVDDIHNNGEDPVESDGKKQSNATAMITFTRSNQEIETSTKTSLLEAAEELGVELDRKITIQRYKAKGFQYDIDCHCLHQKPHSSMVRRSIFQLWSR